MKFVIGTLIVIGLAMGGYHLYEYWGTFRDKNADTTTAAPVQSVTDGTQLPGMPPSLEGPLQTAKMRGAPGLRDFLTQYGNMISDPRRAWIELDYVVLLAESDPGAARAQFAKTKTRVPETSPVYGRIKQLEKTYD